MSLPRPRCLLALLATLSVAGAPRVSRAERPTTTSAPVITTPPVASAPAPKPAVLVVTQTAPGAEGLVATIAEQLSRSNRYALRPLTALRPLLRQHDATARLVSQAAALREQARQAMLALDLPKAHEKLEAARKLLDQTFVAFYEPTTVAELHLLRGVVALQRTRPDLARAAFTRVLHLDPTLQPDAHYSPQVRAAFADARRRLPDQAVPTARELGRLLAQLPQGRLAIVLSGERAAGGLLVLRALTYEPDKHAYSAVEVLTVAQGMAAPARAESFGAKLRLALELRFPAPQSRPASKPAPVVKKRKVPIPPTPPKPWYKRWYVWAIAGAVISAAVVLPLATRREVVDLPLRW